jgi:hypothetical protein
LINCGVATLNTGMMRNPQSRTCNGLKPSIKRLVIVPFSLASTLRSGLEIISLLTSLPVDRIGIPPSIYSRGSATSRGIVLRAARQFDNSISVNSTNWKPHCCDFQPLSTYCLYVILVSSPASFTSHIARGCIFVSAKRICQLTRHKYTVDLTAEDYKSS